MDGDMCAVLGQKERETTERACVMVASFAKKSREKGRKGKESI
jgi:hypothetical protein